MNPLEGRMNRREALQLGAGAFLAVHNVGSVSEALGNFNHLPSISSGAELGFQKSPVSDLICTSRSILKARNRVLQGDGESDILSVSDQLPYGNTGDTISIRLSEILKEEAEDFQIFTYGLHSDELGGSVLFFTNTIDLQLSRFNDFYEKGHICNYRTCLVGCQFRYTHARINFMKKCLMGLIKITSSLPKIYEAQLVSV